MWTLFFQLFCFLHQLNENNKLFLYKNIKNNLDKEFYLSSNNFDSRRVITKLRVSDHNLAIEKGRYLKIPRDQRLCLACNEVDDEIHFILHCRLNSNLRTHLYNSYIEENSFLQKSDVEKVNILLNPSTFKQVNVISSFLKQSFKLRTGDS